MADGPSIDVRELTKRYGSFRAVDNISFRVNAGEVVAFLGPNGAGKTTTMRVLTGYLPPTAGSVRVAGIDVVAERQSAVRNVGYLPENGPLYPDMTPRELLTFFGEARGMGSSDLRDRLGDVADLCAIRGILDKPIRKLSKGYRQRVGMANVLLHDPEILIMDEPTSGLDPNQVRQVRETIRHLGKTKAILLSTHILQEVEAVADRVLMIHRGKIVFDGKPDALRTRGNGNMDEAFYALTEGEMR